MKLQISDCLSGWQFDKLVNQEDKSVCRLYVDRDKERHDNSRAVEETDQVKVMYVSASITERKTAQLIFAYGARMMKLVGNRLFMHQPYFDPEVNDFS